MTPGEIVQLWKEEIESIAKISENPVNDVEKNVEEGLEEIEEIAEEEEHDDIANFAQDRLRKHKKNAWMLRASLES